MAYSKELWALAKKKCRLNVEEIQMAKEMGLNPKSLIKNIPNKSEQWKAPVKVWIRDMYEKRFGRRNVISKSKKTTGQENGEQEYGDINLWCVKCWQDCDRKAVGRKA